MKRFILISIFLLGMIFITSYTASARISKSSSVTVSDTKEMGNNASSTPVSSSTAPLSPAAKTVPPLHTEEKSHSPKVEELPHIHHFHKERVKKIKRHHKKCWTLSMLLLVLCHITLLAMAYMHITH